MVNRLRGMIYGTLWVLAAGLLTSTSLLSLSHILMIVPAGYFIQRTNWKKLPWSFWALLGLSLTMILSVFVNMDIMLEGFSPIFKTKYFFFGLLMVVPFSWYMKSYLGEKEIKKLVYTICAASIIAGVAGTIARYTSYNILLLKKVDPNRNAGVSGMVLNYAYNLAYFEVILFGLILWMIKTKNQLLNRNFILFTFVINLYFIHTTFTKGALVALMIGLPFYFIRNKKNFLIILMVLINLGVGVYFFSKSSFSRPMSDAERLSNWRAAIKAFEEKPVLGFGFTNFEQHSLDIKRRYNVEIRKNGHAHNNYLEVLASTGAVGFFFFMAWILLWFIEMYKRQDLVANMAIPFIITFAVSGLPEASISLGFHLFFIMAAYAISQQKPELVKELP